MPLISGKRNKMGIRKMAISGFLKLIGREFEEPEEEDSKMGKKINMYTGKIITRGDKFSQRVFKVGVLTHRLVTEKFDEILNKADGVKIKVIENLYAKQLIPDYDMIVKDISEIVATEGTETDIKETNGFEYHMTRTKDVLAIKYVELDKNGYERDLRFVTSTKNKNNADLLTEMVNDSVKNIKELEKREIDAFEETNHIKIQGDKYTREIKFNDGKIRITYEKERIIPKLKIGKKQELDSNTTMIYEFNIEEFKR